MKFFKHFTDAHRGTSVQSLINRLGMEGLARYWILVELCAEKLNKDPNEEFTEEHCVFRFDERYLRDTLRTHQLSRLSMFLRCLADVGLMSFSCEENVCVISMPKLLECLDRDTKRARTKRAVSAPKKEKEDKDKEIDKDININSPEARNLAPVTPINSQVSLRVSDTIQIPLSQQLVKSWAETFPKEFLNEEFRKARNWILANPHKAPKKAWGRFLNNWLNRGWDDYRKTLKSNPGAISIDDLNEMLGAS